MAKHTMQELLEWQNLPLSVKVAMTKARIRQWVNEYGEDGVYVSFSGGKDSTVLLHIVREMYPDIVAVYCDTGLEYPEIREFVKRFENVEWVKPKMTFRQVLEKYGYPLISKEVSDCVSMARRGYKSGIDKLNGVDKDGNPSEFRKGFKKWKFLLDMPWDISDECCFINKKEPIKRYEKKTGRKPMTAIMAEESAMRKTSWLRTGCNSYDSKRPMSNPMAFWTEQDVLQYIKENNLEICSVYGKVVDKNELEVLEGQMSITDFVSCALEVDETQTKEFVTTGCKRTGCMFCAYGCHLNNDDRFVRMRTTHPAVYDYIMRPWEEEVEIINKQYLW